MQPFYLIIGTPGSGRSDVLADLIEFGFEKDERALVYYHQDELPAADDHVMRNSRKGSLATWIWNDEKQMSLTETSDDKAACFLVTNPHFDLLDQLESFRDLIEKEERELARIITVVDCGLLHRHGNLHIWYDAAIHFSDVVLLNRRENLQNKWVDDLRRKYTKNHLPCHFGLVKKGRVENPAEILFPEPRRMSLFFDPQEDIPEIVDTVALYGVEITDEATNEVLDEDDLLENDLDDGGELPGTDKYMERRPNGERFHRLPDICSFLEQS